MESIDALRGGDSVQTLAHQMGTRRLIRNNLVTSHALAGEDHADRCPRSSDEGSMSGSSSACV